MSIGIYGNVELNILMHSNTAASKQIDTTNFVAEDRHAIIALKKKKRISDIIAIYIWSHVRVQYVQKCEEAIFPPSLEMV